MSNHQVCAMLDIIGTLIMYLCMCAMFFGMMDMWFGAALGAAIGLIGLVNDD